MQVQGAVGTAGSQVPRTFFVTATVMTTFVLQYILYRRENIFQVDFKK